MNKKIINEMVRRKIRELRLAKNIAVKELAAKAGLPLSSYASMENGDYKINLDNLFRILGVLEADITEVWPSEATGAQATGENVYLLKLQEFRLNEVISLARADGGAVFVSDAGGCSVLFYQNMSDFLIDRIILYLESELSYDHGLWWTRHHRGKTISLFLKADACPAFVERLIDHYMTGWCALVEEELLGKSSKDRQLKAG